MSSKGRLTESCYAERAYHTYARVLQWGATVNFDAFLEDLSGAQSRQCERW